MSSYTDYHKKYYSSHKEEIKENAKDKQYWKAYYENHKEAVKAKALARYYKKKELQKQKDEQILKEIIEKEFSEKNV